MPEIHFFFGVLLFLNLSISCYFYESNTLPDIGNAQFIEECVRVHNKFRSNVNPPAANMKRMSWDHKLAETAKGWAKRCLFQHNSDIKIPGKVHPNFTTAGENIWTGSFQIFNVTSALTDWYNEVVHYNYDTRYCSDVCGHYTQMVWATTYKVGCAVVFCRQVTGFTSNAAHFICNYGPSGNFPTWPYKRGTPCSECDEEPCVDKLCGKVQEESISDQDESIRSQKESICDQYCITILILRPSFALGTLAAVFFVKQRYPTIFFYE
ncbi:pathogenesis-related 1-like [Podarcis lilfordi]|uniref:Pathogenesis-related 1-like n=1 Tax=Podarcis lilfordi TaxID=74358 RepID=A0AA35PHH2_9SAUR|nr:pathogenesis-related 1-like [Podarcis lilfordi]